MLLTVEMAQDISVLKEGQKAILETQQEHDKLLGRLSIRSLTQEADIQALRFAK